ncbi:MAG: carbon-nitrogen hydrolase family protein [Gammaproteobacteria bacterium]|jgi:predicted amidohydrolase|nr:MAG: carbon-nitrogen hydrolase family protein [Gammaproteobacteria bacterium]
MPTRVALAQLCATTNVAENLETAEALVRQGADGGASLILLPEAFSYIGPDSGKREILEPLDGSAPSPILDRFTGLAAELGTEILLGGHHERGPDDGNPDSKSFNTCVHIADDGGIQTIYRKIHLFDVCLEDGTQLNESARTLAGEEVVTTETPLGTLGLTICYDLRFPYLFQRLANEGAIAISVPSAFTASTGAAHWHALLRARAIETQCYVLAPAQHGQHNERRRSYGHSLVIDPWGEVIAELEEGDGVLLADIDPERVASVRRQLPSLEHRVDLEPASGPGKKGESLP